MSGVEVRLHNKGKRRSVEVKLYTGRKEAGWKLDYIPKVEREQGGS